MGTQTAVGTKQGHTMQLAAEIKAVQMRFPIMEWKTIVRNRKDRIFDHRLWTVNRWMPVLERNKYNIAKLSFSSFITNPKTKKKHTTGFHLR